MILTLRDDWEQKVTPEEAEKRNLIVDKVNKRKYVLKGEAEFLLKYDKKTRSCSSCGRTYENSPFFGRWEATAPDRYGKDIPVGLHARCFECELKRIMYEGDNGLLGLKPLTDEEFSKIEIKIKDGK